MTVTSPGKITALALSLIGSFIISNAQIAKGSTYLGGQLSYDSAKDEQGGFLTQKNKSGLFNVAVGHAFKENVIVGISLSFAPGSYSNLYNGVAYSNGKSRDMYFGLFYRQYKKLAKDFYFFGEAGAYYLNGHQTQKDTVGTAT